ncbi:MAG: desulfoferrodoxin family protein [Peptoniphilus sp.]|uniref:Superoxide reductase n=2 Tax=Peptoniphilus indolicus TaxID=33030 RepID=G4D162_9FIRM|nr:MULTISPECIES: desulfoferrodoxin family protein [Peptoniphilus]EGY80739.1 superoxide reductase [Peptoniphilus indolicus ATCC 29427]MDY2986927.1 desulfoferrodoxin family protein [Peptoniphilus sp.]SUB74845.1 Putative superoxide reductase [Peptoniphilus indolicus]
MKLTETVKAGDWKNEKHVPVLHVESVNGELKIHAQVGEEIEHPNTLEHHIGWIKVFFQPEGFAAPVEVGSYNFSAHGEGELLSKPEVHAVVKTDKKGTVYALSYCNIHGLWESAEEVK